MRKIISMMMIAAMAMFTVACDDSDDDGGYESTISGTQYIGTLTTTKDSEVKYSADDVTFYVDVAEDGNSVDVYMPGVSFYRMTIPATGMETGMPYLDMAVMNIAIDASGDYFYQADPDVVNISDFLPIASETFTGMNSIKVTLDNNGADAKVELNSCSISGSAYDVVLEYSSLD